MTYTPSQPDIKKKSIPCNNFDSLSLTNSSVIYFCLLFVFFPTFQNYIFNKIIVYYDNNHKKKN
jgi:hypothetical protein